MGSCSPLYALTKSEELLFEYISENKGLLLWDADSYYTDDKKQEAGFFFRNNKLTTGNFNWKENYLRENKKQITVSGTPLVTSKTFNICIAGAGSAK